MKVDDQQSFASLMNIQAKINGQNSARARLRAPDSKCMAKGSTGLLNQGENENWTAKVNSSWSK